MPKSLAEYKTILNQLIESGQNEKAVNLLSQLAIAFAGKKDFARAEAFRNQLIALDPMALSLIVKINEAIEEGKSAALTPDRRKLWAPFFKAFSKEEGNAFFSALKSVNFAGDQSVLQQGKPNDCLFLVENGQLNLIHENEGIQSLIHTMEQGDFFGEDSFFSINVCTVSVVTVSEVTLSVLEKEGLETLQKQYSQVDTVLKEICGTGERIVERLKKKKLDRRMFERTRLQAKIWFQVLNPDDKVPIKNEVAGELWDISRHGMCFYIKSKQRDAVRFLVGRTISVRFKLGTKKEVTSTGVVQGVKNHPLDEYSLHVKLHRYFGDAALKMIKKEADQQQ